MFSDLNEKQLEAVKNTEGYVRVIAGAGSGKTKLLTNRFAYLVKEYGINAANILCVTFTNKAAAEMKQRIQKLIGAEYTTSLICTYHGFGARLIRENPEKLFLSKGFQIIDTYQQKIIIEEIFQKYELKLDYANFQSLLKKIAQKKQDLSYVTKMADVRKVQILPAIENQDDQIIEDYLQRQKAIYSLDFSDLINYALYLLKNDEEVRNKWQERLNYIQVDEFQDSSSNEMELIDILSDQYKNLLIVGDPDQNIYEWRGSDVKLLVDFDKTHPNTNTIILNQNYRSTPQILTCANTLIEKNSLRLKKDLFTKSAPEINVTHIHSKSEDDEVVKIVKEIKKIKNQNFKYSDMAILYRSGFLSRVIERKLVEENIPYEIYGGVKFYQRMEILDLVAYLRLIAFDDDLSFKRIVNTPRRKFGRTRIATLENIRENNDFNLIDFEAENETENNKSLYSTLKNHLSDKAFSGSGGGEFVSIIERLKSKKNNLKVSDFVNAVCIETGYEEYIRELGDEERLDNLSEFKRIANEFEKGFGEEISLENFLQQITLMSAEESENSTETVKLMTIHAAKGLEFSVVFLIGLSEGIFPSSRTIEERKRLGLEEERRLCYVAITRAKKILYLLDSEGSGQNGIKKLPSRFLFEIGEDNYERIGIISKELKLEADEYSRKLNQKILEAENQLGIETIYPNIKKKKIHHHIFGDGEILSFDSKKNCYKVKFIGLDLPRIISSEYFNEEHKISLENKIDNAIQTKEIIQDRKETQNKGEEQQEIKKLFFDNEFDEKEIFHEKKNSKKIVSEELAQKLKDSTNHWLDSKFPKTNWTCVGITDLKEPVGICEMCGYQIIRYVHHMVHPSGLSLGCGCVCAGKLEGNIERAKQRESTLRTRTSRLENFLKRKWKKSAKGHEYLKIKNTVFVLFYDQKTNKWSFSVNNIFQRQTFSTKKELLEAVFTELEKIKNQ